jgi:hypothetical protein
VHFIKHDSPRISLLKKLLRVFKQAANAREFAVKILNVRQTLTEGGFADSSDSG